MLSLDLFASTYEKSLHEGAVDKLEQRRIEDLNARMDELMARAKEPMYKRNPEAVAGLKREFEKLKAERDSYYKIRETQQPPVKSVLSKDLVTPQQRVAGAKPPATSVMGKARETFSSFVDWLAGREDKGPTYENAQLKESNPNSAINAAKYAYEQMRKAHDDNVDIATIRWMGPSEPITMSRNQLYHTLTKLSNMSRQNRNAFALQVLADRNNFYLWLGGQKKITPRPQLKQPVDPFQQELPLGKPSISPVQERDQKKKPSDVEAGDVKVARELQKIRAKYPAALSDIEALARNEIDSTERANQQLAAIRGANEKQDVLLKQLVALDKEQGQEIDNLDSENNGLEQQLARIQATNDRLQNTIGQMTGTKRSTRAKSEPQPKQTAVPSTTGEIDPVTLQKVQDLETQIQQIQTAPPTADNQEKLGSLERRLSALTATVASKKKDSPEPASFGDLDLDGANAIKISTKPKTSKPASRVKVPIGDLDLNKGTRSRGKKADDDEIDILGMPTAPAPASQPSTASMIEHGGGIGPRQHWQSLMRNESREITTRDDFIRERDRLLRMIAAESNPANKQILRAAIRQLENRAEQEGWITIQNRMIREDNASEAAEQAILKRIMVAHADLLRQYGPEKVMQAAEEVAYNVGDVPEIGTSDVSIWVNQVKQILGAAPSDQQMEEDLKKWFKEKWVRFGPDGKIRGDCARGSSKEGKPKCLPQSKAHALGKKGRASAAAKKRREDPNPERRGPAKNVATRVKEGAVKDLYTELGEKYHELAPKIEKYKDSYLAGELYDALEEIAARHGAMAEFRRMLNGARNRAHMEYDTNPGGFHNWFWFLPFEDEPLEEISDQLMSRYKQKAGQQASELDRHAFSGSDPQAQQKIARANKRFSGIVRATNKQFDKSQVKESLRPGEYYVATVTLDNGEVRKFKVTFDEGYVDAINKFYARQGRTVKNIDMDWSIQGNFYEQSVIEAIPSKSVIRGYTVFYNPTTKVISITVGGTDDQAAIEQARLGTSTLKNYRLVVDKLIDRIESAETLEEKQDACYRKVKSRYKVWPSAYASGALVQCRKKGAANWGTGGKKK